MNGIIPLWKPIGLTSHDCVLKLRRLYGTKKVGHTGTLDPEVEGVLPICIGQATKIVPYLTDTTKTYRAEVTLGIETDTEDQTGKIISQQSVETPVNEESVREVLSSFKGEIKQITPLYSAVKVDGKKLYQYARENIEVKRPIRHVKVWSIHYIENSLNTHPSTQTFSFEACVSKGTYIRTLAKDIGKALGYPAHMSHLVRIKTADFDETNSLTLEELNVYKEKGQLEDTLLPIEAGLTHLATHEVTESEKNRIVYGQKLNRPLEWKENVVYKMTYCDQLLALYHIHPDKKDQIKPVKVFN
ncbi:tRNA pseudouridine synthase B [Pelagirhabdus alkalitolerans]|uniref:tRNA pseudouridine synthase B n=1 Tax=Pelagirhabdus alkalitolerans TaxID=1612202 RepID=A0A1G6H458_9BACI|nr:tRNA pseudouridine(55) synthase TruB [Pelagirhabdus alkalitolerans]SDB89079.1 tRNA pseudouridine synthase B [Pelagirhabdus alkalitolerans]